MLVETCGSLDYRPGSTSIYACQKLYQTSMKKRENMINSSVEGGTFPKLKQALVSNNIHFIHV